MSEKREAPHNIPEGVEYFDSDEELSEALDKISSAIDWIIIEFNSLEDSISFYIKEIVSTSEGRDAFVYALTANMGFAAKSNSLINLYGQCVEGLGIRDLREPLKALESILKEAATRRNQYAHADWSGIDKHHLAAVKMSATRKGVQRVYRTFSPAEMEADLEYIQGASIALENFDEHLSERIHRREP